ncbi:hypothetical protein F4809DRAFT_602053 [Biscogniauxia mediterranea]|nr:hypothetical protein F4809DRAFT_602053 [Biscogniauxia mediterranea]
MYFILFFFIFPFFFCSGGHQPLKVDEARKPEYSPDVCYFFLRATRTPPFSTVESQIKDSRNGATSGSLMASLPRWPST